MCLYKMIEKVGFEEKESKEEEKGEKMKREEVNGQRKNCLVILPSKNI